MCSRSFFSSRNRLFTGFVALLYNTAVANKQYFNHNFKFPFVSWHILAYRGKSPKIRAFFKMLVYPDGRHQIGVKWHILAYAGISWHIIPCKSGKKSGKVRRRTTEENSLNYIQYIIPLSIL